MSDTIASGALADFALWRSVGALLLVLALLVAALWLLRRLQRSGAGRGAGPRLDLEVVGRLALAPKQFVSVVRVGPRLWVLGVTEQSIRYLGEYEGELGGSLQSAAAGKTFATALQKAVRGLGRSFSRARAEAMEHVR